MEQTKLVTILKDAINKKKQEVKEYNERLDQNLSEKIQIMENLKKDINEITKIDINKLNSIIDLFNIENQQKEKLKEELDIIKAVLTLNQKEKTTYIILPTQLETITKFLENLEEYIESKNLEKEKIDPEYMKIIQESKKYKGLLSQIKNPNNQSLITEINIILDLFQKTNIKEEEKQAILLSLIKYNEEVINRKEAEIRANRIGISKNELVILFKKYGYNYDLLEQQYQKLLQKEGKKRNIEEVFIAMQEMEFSKIDEQKQGLLLVSYLLGSDKKTIEETVKIAQARGIDITTIQSLSGAFISNNYLFLGKYKIGSKEEFKKNLPLLSEHGISIKEVALKNKLVLLTPNKKLQENIEWLEKYGFDSTSDSNTLLDDYLSAISSNNIPEIIDLWIESHSLGFEYLKSNLSILNRYFDKNTSLFYKLYYAQKENVSKAFRITISNKVKKLNLKKEVLDSKFFNLNIKDLNDFKKLFNIADIHFSKEDKYYEALTSSSDTISDNIFENKYIKAINRFKDSKETLLYDINGIKISRLKVLRIYDKLCQKNLGNTLDSLLYSICYNKIMTEDEYNKLYIDIRKVIEEKEV